MFLRLFCVLGLVLLTSPCFQTQNIVCMMTHCAEQSKNCMLDNDCRDALMCFTGCGKTNQTCMFRCLYSYEDALFDDFMKCAFTEYKCISMVSPDPSFRCNRPQQVVKVLPPEQIKGPWYIVRGLNPNFDCFDCQITSFNPSSTTPNTLMVHERFDVTTISGGVKHRAINETGQVNSTVGGILEYKSMQMGHETTTEWRILDVDPNGKYMLGYYCGFVSADWYYEGSVVYSRTQTLDSATLTTIASKMKTFGFDMDKYCSPKTTSCAA